MAIQKRSRKPLRSELSDGVKRERTNREIRTIPLPDKNIEIHVEEEIEILQDDQIQFEEPQENQAEEELIREKARELGIKNWWNKKIDSLLAEIKELEVF